MTTCRADNCERKPAFPDQAFCSDHRLRWLPGEPAEAPREPEWMKRRRTVGLPAKAFYGGRAA